MHSRYVILDMGAKATGMEAKLRDVALAYPDTYEEFPWGERALKVKPNKKVFVFMGPKSMSVKLPTSAADVLDMPYAEPTHYGLGKSGWVTVTYAGAAGERPTLDQLEQWIDESFRAIAPKRVLAKL
jgi:predicted DNA-binding protein (MmcQ/YjbR family)